MNKKSDPNHDAHPQTLLPLPTAYESLTKTRFSSWYPNFRRVSQKATILDLVELSQGQDQDGVQASDNSFLDWYESDGIILPKGSDSSTDFLERRDADSDSGSGSGSGSDDDDDDEQQGWSFPLLNQEIRQVIQKYDGAAFPKLDWSAPRDAAFLLPGNNLRCVLPSDVYLLLKGSDFVSKDIEQVKELEWKSQNHKLSLDHKFPNANPDQHFLNRSEPATDPTSRSEPSSVDEQYFSTQSLESGSTWIRSPQIDASSSPSGSLPPLNLHLVLKPHLNIQTSNEFRCFVRSNQLIAISQRDSVYLDHLNNADENGDLRWKIKSMIRQFWLREMNGGMEDQISNTAGIQEASTQAQDPALFVDQSHEVKEIEDVKKITKQGQKGKVGLTSYIFDIYLTRDYAKAFILDINPWLERTDPLLWEWDELEGLAKKRMQDSWRSEKKEGVADELESFIRVPIQFGDAISGDDLTGETQNGAEKQSDGYQSYNFEVDEDQDEDEDGSLLPILRLITNPNSNSHQTNDSESRADPLNSTNLKCQSQSVSNESNIPTVFPTQSTPTYSNNMVPADFMEATAGMTLAEAAEKWERRLRDATTGGSQSESDSDSDNN